MKDFKTYDLINDGKVGIGVASIVVPMDLFIEKFANLADEMDLIMKERNLGLFLICTNHDQNGVFKKELAIYTCKKIMDEDESLYIELKDVLKSDSQYNLKNTQLQIQDEEREFVSWDVGNLKMSRKDLEKILKEFYIYKV